MILSVVATPIGNLQDISLRAKEVLSSASLIIAEDTRTTGKLLKLFEIESDHRYASFHAQTSPQALLGLLKTCAEHEHIALVTDAGTPGISDPGCVFIAAFKKEYPEASVVPIPGASAVISALSVSGYPASHFEFVGFLPHKKGKQTLMRKIVETEHTVVFYESPHRILKTLGELSEHIGDRDVFIAREITKMHESYTHGSCAYHKEFFTTHPDMCRGEFVCVVSPKR
jgi:16S rRNA (cytidine1402-2'-O)-methyltransferase